MDYTVTCSGAGLRRHDVLFLVTLRPPNSRFMLKRDEPIAPQLGITYVRGCEVEGVLDAEGKLIDEMSYLQRSELETRTKYKNANRTFRVWLDPNQYYMDLQRVSKNGTVLNC